MKYKGVSRENLMSDIPYTITYLESIDSGLKDVELAIRDTDHRYNSLRLETNDSHMIPDAIRHEVCRHTETHCCICGSDYLVREADIGFDISDTYGATPFWPYVCIDCYEKLYRDNVDAITLVKFQIKRCTEEGNKYKAPHKKVRLLTTDRHIVYRFVDEISVVGEEYFITPQNQASKNNLFSAIKSLFHTKREAVTILGVDTGKRDINDERIFTNDVLLVESKGWGEANVKWFATMYWMTTSYKRCACSYDRNPRRAHWELVPADGFGLSFDDALSVKIVCQLHTKESLYEWFDRNKDQLDLLR